MIYNDFDIAENRKNSSDLHPKGCAGLGYQGANIPKYHNFYNDDIKNKVYEYYKEDFIKFNYSNSIPNN